MRTKVAGASYGNNRVNRGGSWYHNIFPVQAKWATTGSCRGDIDCFQFVHGQDYIPR